MAAAHLDNFLFLLFIAVAIFFQLLTRAASKGGRRSDGDTTGGPTPPPPPRSGREQREATEEDRIRKFLEALGQPTTAKPPPPAVPRPTYQRPTILPHGPPPLRSPLPPLKTRPPESESAAVFEVQQSPAPSQPRPSVVKAAEEAYSIETQPISKSTDSKTDLVTKLRSASGLRDAIILREIFGPPRSLQPLDLVENI